MKGGVGFRKKIFSISGYVKGTSLTPFFENWAEPCCSGLRNPEPKRGRVQGLGFRVV